MAHTKFNISIMLETAFPVADAATVQAAMLRALATPTFGLRGHCNVTVNPLNTTPIGAEDLARPGQCPCRGCDAPLKRKAFFCGPHFKMLPAPLQRVLVAAKDLGSDELAQHATGLAEVMQAGIGEVAEAEGKGATRDEKAMMAKYTPVEGNA